jgi:hypothetical protein
MEEGMTLTKKEEEICIHNEICLKSNIQRYIWLGCPYPIICGKYTPELLKCNLCDIEVIVLKKPVTHEKYLRHWRGYLEDTIG